MQCDTEERSPCRDCKSEQPGCREDCQKLKDYQIGQIGYRRHIKEHDGPYYSVSKAAFGEGDVTP